MQGILLISSGQIALALYEKAAAYFGHVPNQFDYHTLSFLNSDIAELNRKITELDSGEGVIILADERYSDEITNCCHKPNCQLITGINQPLLLNILMERLRDQPLNLARIIGNGRDGLSVIEKP